MTPLRRILPLLLAAAVACTGESPDAGDGASADAVDTIARSDAGTAVGGSPAPDSPAADTARPDGAAPDTAAWQMPPLRGVPEGSGTGTALLTGVRTGRHAGYDRVVFEFAEHLPEYTIRYVQDPTACGSGEPVDVAARTALEIDLRPAAAHDEEGRGTFGPRVLNPELPTLRSARITCDFEAIVTWVLGLDHRPEVRVLELASPPRLVVDVRHR